MIFTSNLEPHWISENIILQVGLYKVECENQDNKYIEPIGFFIVTSSVTF